MMVPMAAACALAALRPAPWTASASTKAAGRLLKRFAPTAPAAAETAITAAGVSRTGPRTRLASQAVTPADESPSTSTPMAATKTSSDQPMPWSGPTRRPPSRSTPRRSSQAIVIARPSGRSRADATAKITTATPNAARSGRGMPDQETHESVAGRMGDALGRSRR